MSDEKNNTDIHHDHQNACNAVLEASPEAEPPKKVKFRFTPENARLMSVKAIEARRRNAAIKNQPLPEVTVQPTANGLNGIGHQDQELELVQEQISRMREQLREDMEPGERAQLVRALDLMLDRKRILQERPLPGSRRPAPEVRSAARAATLLSGQEQPARGETQGQEQE